MTMNGSPSSASGAKPSPRGVVRPVSVAPMMDRTDRHFRFLMRQITRHTLLYTEMLHCGAVLQGNKEHLLGFSPEEKPLSLQLGGDDPQKLAACARIAEDMGYDEVNLNVGCPSDRVQNGNFGACLMAHPERVADSVAAMRAAISLPVTVKHRIGIDDKDSYEDLARFVEIVSQAGCDRFTVHARAAWLKGLSPKENREIPPLRYPDVYRLKREFPHLVIELNGGVTRLEEIREHLGHVDAVMIGRAAYDNPFLFATVDRDFFGDAGTIKDRREVLETMLSYAESWCRKGERLSSISRHLLNLSAGQPGGRAFRRFLSERAPRPGAGPEVLREALSLLASPGKAALSGG